MEFDVLFPHVLPYAQGCGEPTAIHHIRQAAIKFCKRTRLWRNSSTITVTEEGDDPIAAPTDAEIFEIEEALFDGHQIEPISLSELKEKHPTWRSWTPGEPRFITQSEPDTIRLVPTYAGDITLELFLQPSEDSQTLPDFLSKHAAIIASGALATLLLLPRQPFSNPDLGLLSASQFEESLASLSTHFIRGQQRARKRTISRFF